MSTNVLDILIKEPAINTTISSRTESSPTGSDWCATNLNVTGFKREELILNEIAGGNIPDYLRRFKPITISSKETKITYFVTSNYLSIGSDEDYCLIPMFPETAQKIANLFDCSLPTRKMVDDIYLQSELRLTAKPMSPTTSMTSTKRYLDHDNLIKTAFKFDHSRLVAGHKKDIVITNKLAPNNPRKRVAIYGWFKSDGKAIQTPVNAGSHGHTYVDYSHGVRLISNDIVVNGEFVRLQDVLINPKLCPLLSDEGPLQFFKY